MMFTMMPYNRMNRNELNPFSNDFFRAFFSDRPAGAFRVDVQDEGDRYLLEAELPGVEKENVHVTLEDGVMTIAAERNTQTEEKQEDRYLYRERRCGRVSRSFRVEGVQEDGVTAEFVNGILKLNLPKLAEQMSARREIAIA